MDFSNVKYCCVRSSCEETPREPHGKINRVNLIRPRMCSASRKAVARLAEEKAKASAAKAENNRCDHGGVGSVGEDVVDKKKKKKKKKKQKKMMDKKTKGKKRKTEMQSDEQPALKKKKTKKKKLRGSTAEQANLENPVMSQLKLCSTTQAEKMVVADPDPKCP